MGDGGWGEQHRAESREQSARQFIKLSHTQLCFVVLLMCSLSLPGGATTKNNKHICLLTLRCFSRKQKKLRSICAGAFPTTSWLCLAREALAPIASPPLRPPGELWRHVQRLPPQQQIKSQTDGGSLSGCSADFPFSHCRSSTRSFFFALLILFFFRRGSGGLMIWFVTNTPWIEGLAVQ